MEDDFKSCGSLISAVFIFLLVSIAWFSSDTRDGFVLQDRFTVFPYKICSFGNSTLVEPLATLSNLKRDVAKIIGQCQTRQLAKHGVIYSIADATCFVIGH